MGDPLISYTAVSKSTLTPYLYEGSAKTENQVLKNMNEHWEITNDWLANNLPVAAVEKEAWNSFWNRFEIYVKLKNVDTEPDEPEPPTPPEPEPFVELDSADFTFIDFIGKNTGGVDERKVYATSPSLGLYVLSVNNSQLVMQQAFQHDQKTIDNPNADTYGCCHIVYNPTYEKFIMCSDNRTNIEGNCIMIWNGNYNSQPTRYRVSNPCQYKSDDNLPFNHMTRGVVMYNEGGSGTETYGYYVSAYRCVESMALPYRNNYGYGAYWFRESYLSNPDDVDGQGHTIATKIHQLPSYDGTPNIDSGAKYSDNTNQYTAYDIKYYQFNYTCAGTSAVNRFWIIGTGKSIYNNNGEGDDLLITNVVASMEKANGYLIQRFQFYSAHPNQIVSRTLSSNSSHYEYKQDNVVWEGNGIIVICNGYNTGTRWIPGCFQNHKWNSFNFNYGTDGDKAWNPFVLFQGVDVGNKERLYCLDLDNYALLSDGYDNFVEKFCFNITHISVYNQSADSWCPQGQSRRVNKITLNSSSIKHYLQMMIDGDDNVWFFGSGGALMVERLNNTTWSDTSETLNPTEYSITVQGNSVELRMATTDSENIFGIGVYNSGANGVALAINVGVGLLNGSTSTNNGSNGSSNEGTNSGTISTVPELEDQLDIKCYINRSNTTISSLYTSIKGLLTTIKNNKDSTNYIHNDSTNYTTWKNAYERLCHCRDVEIADFMTGRREDL